MRSYGPWQAPGAMIRWGITLISFGRGYHIATVSVAVRHTSWYASSWYAA